MRKKIVAGNWKMNKTPVETVKLLRSLKTLVEGSDADIIICPPFVDLPAALSELKGSMISVGAQNMHFEDSGAYTGEISPAMLFELGVEYVIIGHSERRQYFAETNETVNKKVLKAFEYELYPIICCGESLEQREEGMTLSWIKEQILAAFNGVSIENAESAIIAYEPIWAIGTGKVATSEQAEEVCMFIRTVISELYDDLTADKIRILYGGSVNGNNAAELFSMPDIDGGLIGGASLKEEFGTIAHYNK